MQKIFVNTTKGHLDRMPSDGGQIRVAQTNLCKHGKLTSAFAPPSCAPFLLYRSYQSFSLEPIWVSASRRETMGRILGNERQRSHKCKSGRSAGTRDVFLEYKSVLGIRWKYLEEPCRGCLYVHPRWCCFFCFFSCHLPRQAHQ